MSEQKPSNNYQIKYGDDWMKTAESNLNSKAQFPFFSAEDIAKLEDCFKEQTQSKSEAQKLFKGLNQNKPTLFGQTSTAMSHAVQMAGLQIQISKISQTYEGRELIKQLNLMHDTGLISTADFYSELNKAAKSSKDKPYTFNKNCDYIPQTYSEEDLFKKIKEAEKSRPNGTPVMTTDKQPKKPLPMGLTRPEKLTPHEVSKRQQDVASRLESLLASYIKPDGSSKSIDSSELLPIIVSLAEIASYVFVTQHNQIHAGGQQNKLEELQRNVRELVSNSTTTVSVLQNHSSNLTTLNTTTESLHSAMAELKKEIEQLKIEKLELKKSNDRLRADLGPRKRKIKGKPKND